MNSKCGVQSKRKCESHESCVCIADFLSSPTPPPPHPHTPRITSVPSLFWFCCASTKRICLQKTKANHNNSNNNNILYSSQQEIKAVIRSHNEEHVSIILSHETHAHTHSYSQTYALFQSAYTNSKPQITWNNAFSVKTKLKNSQIK